MPKKAKPVTIWSGESWNGNKAEIEKDYIYPFPKTDNIIFEDNISFNTMTLKLILQLINLLFPGF